MDTYPYLCRALALSVATFLLACGEPGGSKNLPGGCPNTPTNPECQDYCGTDPTASWCTEADSGNNTSANNDAGNTDAATSPSDADTVPCDGACSNGEVCDQASDTCVKCLSAGDCLDGVCQLDATDSSNNRCVTCLADADCVAGVCDTDSNACVACLADTDCSEADATKCVLGATTADNACGGCDDSSQCAGIAGTEVCDVGDGICVECLDDSDTTRAACGGNSCDPATNSCTGTPVAMTGVCESCVADSECAAGAKCILMEFAGSAHGTYCLRPASEGCSAPYVTSILSTSLSGAPATEYCGIDQGAVTCEAILGAGTECNMADECGAVGLSDARCEDIDLGNSNKCTVACETVDDCPIGACTGGAVPDKYCD